MTYGQDTAGKDTKGVAGLNPGVLAAWAVPTKGLLWRGSFESPCQTTEQTRNQQPLWTLAAWRCLLEAYGARQQSDQRRRRRRLARVKYQQWGGTADNPRAGGEWLETQAALLLLVLAAAAYLRG